MSTDLNLTNRWGGKLAATFTPGPGDSAALLLHGFLSDRRAGRRFDRHAVGPGRPAPVAERSHRLHGRFPVGLIAAALEAAGAVAASGGLQPAVG